MPGLANLLYLGQPDPEQQIAKMLSGQQPGGQPPQAGPPGATPSPGGPGPGAQPPAQPQPQALQSPPDLQAANQQLANPPNIMSLYVQMDQRDRAMQGINQAFAQIAANHSPLSMRQGIMQGANAGAGDPGSIMGNLMSLYQMQNQMGAQQALLAQAPAIAQKLGLDEATVRAEILAGRGAELVKSEEPTPETRDINAKHDMFIKSGGSEEEWQKNYLPLIITGGIPGAGPATRSRVQALTKWQNDPANAGKTPPAYYADDQKWDLYNKDLDTARGQFGGLNGALGEFIDRAGEIAADPELVNVTGSPANAAKAKLAPGSTDAGVLASKMGDLGGLAKAMASRQGPKGVGQNLATLGANPESFTNFGIKDYGENVVAPKIRIALTAQANAYGAAGRVNEMPGYLKPYLDPMFQEHGDLDPGGGYKPFTINKDLKQPSAEDMSDFTHNLEHFGPKKAIQIFKDNKIDTSGLE